MRVDSRLQDWVETVRRCTLWPTLNDATWLLATETVLYRFLPCHRRSNHEKIPAIIRRLPKSLALTESPGLGLTCGERDFAEQMRRSGFTPFIGPSVKYRL